MNSRISCETAAVVVKKLEKMSKKVTKSLARNKHWKMADTFVDKFKEVATVLSSLLPDITDTSITDIDDILYQNTDKDAINKSKSNSVEYKESIVKKCFKIFNIIYKEVVFQCSHHQILDTVCLQLIDHSSDEVFKSNYSECDVLMFTDHLIRHRSETNICRALKILKLSVAKHRSVIESHIEKEFKYCNTILWLSQFLPNIPEAKQPQKKRVTSWLSQQSKATFENLTIETSDEDMLHIMYSIKLLKEKDFDENYIMTIAQNLCINTNLYLVDHLYQYFSSAQTEEQKLQRIRDFLKGYCMTFYSPDEQEMSIQYGSFIKNFGDLHFSLEFSLFKITKYTEYSEDFLKVVDKYHHNDMEPYIPESNNYSTDVSATNEQPMSDNKEAPNSSENEPDFTIEKFLFYDEFLKILYLMSTVYDICMRCPEFIKVEGDCDGFEAKTFRSFFYTGIIAFRLQNPDKCGTLEWWLQTALRKYPFLFVNKRHEYMIEDIIKALKGEEIDDSEILDELKHKVKEKKVLNQDEVGFGTVDGILEDLKNEPFVRSDAYYKSRRK